MWSRQVPVETSQISCSDLKPLEPSEGVWKTTCASEMIKSTKSLQLWGSPSRTCGPVWSEDQQRHLVVSVEQSRRFNPLWALGQSEQVLSQWDAFLYKCLGSNCWEPEILSKLSELDRQLWRADAAQTQLLFPSQSEEQKQTEAVICQAAHSSTNTDLTVETRIHLLLCGSERKSFCVESLDVMFSSSLSSSSSEGLFFSLFFVVKSEQSREAVERAVVLWVRLKLEAQHPEN